MDEEILCDSKEAFPEEIDPLRDNSFKKVDPVLRDDLDDLDED
jgi:hypothetical protein